MTKPATKKRPTQELIEGTAHAALPAPQPSRSEALLSVIERAASMDSVDVLKMQELYGMLKEMRADEAKAQFAQDWVRMKPALPMVIRTKKNTHTSSNYAPQEEINKIIDPILSQYGFGTGAEVISQTKETVTMRVEVWHQSGHVKSTTITMPVDDKGLAGKANKTELQGISSAITYCKRVGTCLLLNISTGDDKDGNGTGSGKREQAESKPVDKFSSRVNQQASENKAERGDREIITDANTLKERLKALVTKSEREALMQQSLPLLRELEAIGRKDAIENLHAITARGEADAQQ